MNDKAFIVLIALAVILTGLLCTLLLNNRPNCYQVEYQKQGITKQLTVCERTNK